MNISHCALNFFFLLYLQTREYLEGEEWGKERGEEGGGGGGEYA